MIELQTFDDLSEATIPDGIPPVRLTRLKIDSTTGASTSLVVFPPGWRRDVTGSYAASEDFLVIAGSLNVSGIRLGAGDLGGIPAGALRWSSFTEEPTRTLAWFSGAGNWAPSSEDTATRPTWRLASRHLGSADGVSLPTDGQDGQRAEIRLGPFEAAVGSEIVNLDTFTWFEVDAEHRAIGPGRFLIRWSYSAND